MFEHVVSVRKRQEAKDMQTFLSELEPYVGLYFKFCSSQIANMTDWDAAKRLTNVLGEVQAVFPGLPGPIGTGLIHMFKADLDASYDGGTTARWYCQ